MSEDLVRYEVRDAVARVFLNHPPMNALDVPTKLALEAALIELEADAGLRAVVLAGNGDKAFAAGADISAFPDLTPVTAKSRLMRSHRVFARLENFPAPVIAAIHGYCLGGGLELALCCDVRYASEDALFGFPEVKLSVFPGNGGTARALHFLGLGRFKKMVYTGDMIAADDALEYGLVEKVAPKGAHLEAALELAEKIARRGPLGIRAAKRVINRTRDLQLAEALELESDQWAGLAATEDMKEGARAFLEKRKPEYRGR